MQSQVYPVVEKEKDRKWEYRGWKILKTSIGTFECVKFNKPGEVVRQGNWFRADKFELAIVSIDRRETSQIEVIRPEDLH